MAGNVKDEVKQVMFTNLQLLGLHAASMERKLKIPINRDMFNLPNKKGFEAIMHFLFSKLDIDQCKEQFRLCWPVIDKKSEQQFRKKCHEWLTSISTEDSGANLPRISPSLLLSPGGEKFCYMLMSFSRYVLYKTATTQYGARSKELVGYPTITPQSARHSGITGKVLRLAVSRHRQKLIEHTEPSSSVQETWKQQAREIVKEHRSLNKAIRDCDKEVEDLRTAASLMRSPSSRSRATTHLDSEMHNTRRAQRVQKVRSLWKQVDEFSRSHDHGRETLESVVDGELDKYKIDGSQLNIRIPDLLLRECELEIQRRNVENVYQGGKVNLLSLTHLWNLSLHLFIEKLHRVGLPSYEETGPRIREHLHAQQAHLANTEALRSKIEEDLIPSCKTAIESLKRKLDMTLIDGENQDQDSCQKVQFGLLPPTPPVTFDPANTPEHPESHLPHVIPRLEQSQLATPEAASHLVEIVSDKVRSRKNKVVQGSAVFGPRTPVEKQTAGMAKYKRQASSRASKDMKKSSSLSNVSQTKSSQNGLAKSVVKPRGALIKTEESPVKQAQHALSSQLVKSSSLSNVNKSSHDVKTQVKRTGQKSQQGEVKPRVDKHKDVLASKLTSPRARDLLAEQIAEAVVSGEGIDDVMHSLHHPTDAYDLDAFKSKEKLVRTPPDQRSTWQDVLMEDSIGPLSSTRIENPPALPPNERPQAHKVAQRLFESTISEGERMLPTTTPSTVTESPSRKTPSSSTPTQRKRNSPIGAELEPASGLQMTPELPTTPSSIHSIHSHTTDANSPEGQTPAKPTTPKSEKVAPPLVRVINFDMEIESSEEDNTLVEERSSPIVSSQDLQKAEELFNKTVSSLKLDLLNLNDAVKSSPDRVPSLIPDLRTTSPFTKTPMLPRFSKRSLRDTEMNSPGSSPSSEAGRQGFNLPFSSQRDSMLPKSAQGLPFPHKQNGLMDSSVKSAEQVGSPVGLDCIEPPADFQSFARSAHTPGELFARLESEEASETITAGIQKHSLAGSVKLTQSDDVQLSSHNSDSYSEIGDGDQVKAITFQNGSFSEVFDKSPIKTLEKEELSLRTNIKEDSLTSKLEAELESWRKKGLVSLSPPSHSPPKNTSVLSSNAEHMSTQSHRIPAADDSSHKMKKSRFSFGGKARLSELEGPGIEDEDFTDLQDMLISDLPNTNSPSKLLGTSPRKASGFTMSPLTHSLHNTVTNTDPLMDDQWQDIIQEGSFLVPSSPAADAVPTANLLDL